MPVRSRPADDPPRHTPSFVCEVPLRVSRTQERPLLARLEAARQVYNACLGEARQPVRLVRETKTLQRAPILAAGLACPVKYVRLVRRKLGERNRFYAQVVCTGRPYRKSQHALGTGVVGLDLGPSTIAVVSAHDALLQPFCPEVAPDAKALRRLERQLDRQRRGHNA